MKWLLIALSLASPFIGNCCSCVALGKIDDKQYEEYSVILKGKITKVTENKSERIITIRVDKYFKGDQTKEVIEINTPKGSGMCGIFPNVGEDWLIFAYSSGEKFNTSLCTRTKTMNPKGWGYNKEVLDEDLRFLEDKTKKKASQT